MVTLFIWVFDTAGSLNSQLIYCVHYITNQNTRDAEECKPAVVKQRIMCTYQVLNTFLLLHFTLSFTLYGVSKINYHCQG